MGCCGWCCLPSAPQRSEAGELVQVQPDEEGLADDVLIRDEAPDTAVARIVAVVAHHEIMALRYGTCEAIAIVGAIAGGGARRHYRGPRGVLEQDLVLHRPQRLDVP